MINVLQLPRKFFACFTKDFWKLTRELQLAEARLEFARVYLREAEDVLENSRDELQLFLYPEIVKDAKRQISDLEFECSSILDKIETL